MSLLHARGRPLRRPRRPSPACPFCERRLPEPGLQLGVFSGDGCRGGRCACGAAFALDETGKLGGQALLDAQALLCDGDLERALGLDLRAECEVRSQPLPRPGANPAPRKRRLAFPDPQVWAVRWNRRAETSE